MAMEAGSVSVSAEGVVTGSGLALDRYNAEAAEIEAEFGDLDALPNPVMAKKAIARRANAYATADVAYWTANAKARIGDADSGLQTSTAAGLPTDAPATTKLLSIV